MELGRVQRPRRGLQFRGGRWSDNAVYGELVDLVATLW